MSLITIKDSPISPFDGPRASDRRVAGQFGTRTLSTSGRAWLVG